MADTNQPPAGSDSALDMVYVKRVKAKYEATLMAMPHVVGVGIGLTPAATAAQERSQRSQRSLALVVNVDAGIAITALPKELEGVPVTVKTTGEFQAF